MADKNQTPEICPECGGKVIYNASEKICSECGLIIDLIFDISKSNKLDKPYVAVGENNDFIGGLGTFIDYEHSRDLKDNSGRLLAPSEQKLFRRLKSNYSQFLRIKNHETEYRIFNILIKITNYLHLNKKIRNNAAYYYKKIIKNEKKVINNITLIAFCIFYASRKEYHNAPITMIEIAKAFQNFGHRVNPRLMLRDGLRYKEYLNNKTELHKSEDYLASLINNVINHENLNERIEMKGINWSKAQYGVLLTTKCQTILQNLNTWMRGGQNPFILTGAVIYLADKLLSKQFNQKALLTQKLISEATGIAEYSIRDHYVNLLKLMFIDN